MQKKKSVFLCLAVSIACVRCGAVGAGSRTGSACVHACVCVDVRRWGAKKGTGKKRGNQHALSHPACSLSTPPRSLSQVQLTVSTVTGGPHRRPSASPGLEQEDGVLA